MEFKPWIIRLLQNNLQNVENKRIFLLLITKTLI